MNIYFPLTFPSPPLVSLHLFSHFPYQKKKKKIMVTGQGEKMLPSGNVHMHPGQIFSAFIHLLFCNKSANYKLFIHP